MQCSGGIGSKSKPAAVSVRDAYEGRPSSVSYVLLTVTVEVMRGYLNVCRFLEHREKKLVSGQLYQSVARIRTWQ